MASAQPVQPVQPVPSSYQVVPLGDFRPAGLDGAGLVVGQTGPYAWTPATWQAGTVQPLPIGRATLGIVEAVDEAGRAAGWVALPDGSTRAVRWRDGQREVLLSLGGGSAMAHGVHRGGWVYGESVAADGQWHATVWQGRLPVKLPSLPGADGASAATGNRWGLVVGHCHLPDRVMFTAQATAWIRGRPQALQGVGGESVATGLNRAGVIIGFGYLADNNSARALVWRDPAAAPQVLDDLPGHSSFAQAINTAGTVVGRSFAVDPQVGQRGVAWEGTRIVDLSTRLPAALRDAGWYVENATGIDDAGTIVGRLCLGVVPKCQGAMLVPG